MSEIDRAGGDDAKLAFLYAGGELDVAAAEAFESRLADDQAARDALCAAVQARQALTGDAGPDPAYRARVRRRLLAGRPRAASRFGIRAPAGWALAGAAAAALLVLSVRLAVQPPQPAEDAAPVAAKQAPAAAACCDEANDSDDVPELLGGPHLARAVHEENRRKLRAENRMARLEEQAARLRGAAPTFKQ